MTSSKKVQTSMVITSYGLLIIFVFVALIKSPDEIWTFIRDVGSGFLVEILARLLNFL
jgi:hypothetical protein